MNDKPRVLSSRELYRGRVFSVRIDTLEANGTQYQMDIVEHPGSFAIAPVVDARHIALVRQYRHAAGRALWEIPAGTAEPEEDPLIGARRELREETGYSADSLELLCTVYPTPGFCTERVHIYAAYGLHSGAQALEPDEQIEFRTFSFDEAWRMQASGQIADMKTMLALLWFRRQG